MVTSSSNTLVLEVLKQNHILKMSIFEQEEAASTLRHYSQCQVSFEETDRLCQEVAVVLNRVDKGGDLPLGSLLSLRRAGQLLWDQLFTGPIKTKLKAAPAGNLILFLDEELISIPWELLYDGEDFLCLRFNLGRLVRTQELARSPRYRSPTGPPRMLILANPTEDLESAYLEGLDIRNQLDKKRKQISIDFKSTLIDRLYVKKVLRDYDIVHFAGHCEYDNDDPGGSGWVFSDGRFTPQDIYAMGETLLLPMLVFSNACYSAKIKPDLLDMDYQRKTYSLAAAFLFSGTRHYIGAVRNVEDTSSLMFAREFYNQLVNGKSVGECVRLARQGLIKERGIPGIAWAGYLLYGDPGFTLFTARPKITAPGIGAPGVNKKSFIRLTALACLISICIYLSFWLPTLNPNTYLLFIKAHKLSRLGKNQEALFITQRIIDKEPLFLGAYPLLADTQQKLGRTEEALRNYFAYAVNSGKKGDDYHLASAYTGIGWIYQLQGEYAKSYGFYEKAALLSAKNKDSLNQARALRKLAVWHMDVGDYNKALELLTKSSEINRNRQYLYEYRYNLACDYFDLGLVFANKDDFSGARDFYNKSLKIFEKLRLKSEFSDYYFNQGEVYLFEKQYQKALESYMRGLRIDESQGNKFNMASDYNMIGDLYLAMDDAKQAEVFYKQAMELSRQINARLELASAYHSLGLLYKNKGRKNKAREYLRQAQEIYRLVDGPFYREVKEDLLSLDNR